VLVIEPFVATVVLGGGFGEKQAVAREVFRGVAFNELPTLLEQVLKIYSTLSVPLQGTKMPVFDTEGSWGSNGSIPSISDPDQQAAFTARYLLVQQSAGANEPGRVHRAGLPGELCSGGTR